MSKGKTDSTSSRAFAGEKNTNVGNMVFDSKRLVTPCEGEKRKKPHFYDNRSFVERFSNDALRKYSGKTN